MSPTPRKAVNRGSGIADFRGSRARVLEWVRNRSAFIEDLGTMLGPVPASILPDTRFMPHGLREPRGWQEARLETFGPEWIADQAVWRDLKRWWLGDRPRGNTPNWDVAVGCIVEGRRGLVLVEAKAHVEELSRAGKRRPDKGASPGALANHDRIGQAITEACDGWREADPGVRITRDTHYQLANRLAFTWKLAGLGVPVVLVYLGFTGDSSVGTAFVDDADWRRAFLEHSEGCMPPALLGRRLDFRQAPAWVFVRSRPVG